MEAPVVTNGQRNAGFIAGFDRGRRIRFGQRKRFFAEYMFPVFGRSDGLRCMHGIRRDQNDSVDFRICNYVLVGLSQFHVVLFAKCFCFVRRGAGNAGDEADVLAHAGYGFHQGFSPPTESNNGCIDHELPIYRLSLQRVWRLCLPIKP